MPSLKPFSLLPLLLPLALAACDSGQPSYSASNATTPAPAPAAQPAPPPAAPAQPPPVAEQAPTAAAPAPAHAGAGAERSRAAPPMQPSAAAIRLPPAEQVGIGACDDYVSRYRACLEKDNSGMVAPPQRKYQLAHVLARQVREWKVLQAKDGKSGDIARACTEANSQAKETLAKLGCRSF